MKIERVVSRIQETAKKDVMAMFTKLFAFRRDLTAGRTKGTDVESIADELKKICKFEKVESNDTVDDWGGHIERLRYKTDKSVGYYYGASSWGGIPTLLVGTKDKATWISLRDKLRAKQLVR
jgi:hypothetical protein